MNDSQQSSIQRLWSSFGNVLHMKICSEDTQEMNHFEKSSIRRLWSSFGNVLHMKICSEDT